MLMTIIYTMRTNIWIHWNMFRTWRNFCHYLLWNNYMCANPEKFQSIILNRDGMQSLAISVQDNTIVSNASIKVLGVPIYDKLKFDKYISKMCTKASRQIDALKRVSKYLDGNCRIMIYKTFISSTFNYCPISWMFYGKTNLNKLEKLQERGLRFVFRDTTSSYENLLTRGDFLPLYLYRIRCLGIEVCKCFNGLNPDYLNNPFKQPCLKYKLRDSHRQNSIHLHMGCNRFVTMDPN